MASLKRNVANQVIFFGLFESASGAGGVPATGATFTSSAWVTIDNGAQAGFAGTFTELGNGQYKYAPTQAETNGTSVGILIAPTGAGALGVHLQFFTDQVDGNGLLQVDVADWAGSAVSAAVSGIPEVDVRYVNGHVTTVDANNLLSVNVADYLGSAALATPNVNVVSVAASASNIKKGQALSNFKFVMLNSTTNQPQTGLAVTAVRDIDGSGFGPCVNAVSEVGSGWYAINLSSSDMNGNVIAFRFTAANANDTNLEIITQP